jgi:hypothetical protein
MTWDAVGHNSAMRVMNCACAGLDVHQKMVVVCSLDYFRGARDSLRTKDLFRDRD